MIVSELIKFECDSIKRKDGILLFECTKNSEKFPIEWSFKMVYNKGSPVSHILYSFSKKESNCIGIDLKIKAKVFSALGRFEKRSETQYIENGKVLKFSIPSPGFNSQPSNIKELVNIEFQLNYRYVKEKYDFDVKTDLTNVELQLKNGVVFVNKQILAINSQYFNALFFGNFSEFGKEQIAINDVDKDDFVELLNYTYNYATEFDKERNCRIVMELADRFDIPHVRLECDDFSPAPKQDDLFNREPENKMELSKLMREFVQKMETRELRERQKESERVAKNGKVKKYDNVGSLKDFSSESDLTDTILVINGTTLHVNKYMLAAKSPVFKAMFFNGEECDKNEFVIDNVNPEEFVVFLRYVYNYCIRATKENYLFLLNLAEKFEIEFIKRICEKYLISVVEYPIYTFYEMKHDAEMLDVADKYSLLDIADKYSLPRANYYYVQKIGHEIFSPFQHLMYDNIKQSTIEHLDRNAAHARSQEFSHSRRRRFH